MGDDKIIQNNHNADLVKKMFNGSLMTMISIILSTTVGMMVDGIVTGRCLGVQSMTAYGLSSPILLIVVAFGGIFASGCQTVSASFLSKGEKDKAEEVFSTSFWTTIILSVVLTIIIIATSSTVAKLLGATGDIIAQTSDYIIGFAIGIPAVILTSLLQPMLQIEGQRKLVTVSVLTMTVADIIGDLLNAYVIKAGLLGMGLATALSYYIAVGMNVFYYVIGKSALSPKLNKIKISLIGGVIKTGIPTAVSRISNTIKSALTIRIVLASIGSLGVAAISVQTSVDSFLGCACSAIGMTVLMITSVLYGEEDKGGLHDLFIQAVKMTVIITGIISIIILCFSNFIVQIFLKDVEAFEVSSKCLQIYAFALPFIGFNACFQNFYQGTRKIGLTNMICILERMCFVSACVFIFSKTGIHYGAFIGIPAGEILMTITVIIVAMIRNKKIKISVNELLDIDDSFDESDVEIIEFTVKDLSGLAKTMDDVIEFCNRCEIDNRKMNRCVLIIEELTTNILSHGFVEGQNRVDIKLISKEDKIKIRIRDDCSQFDPISYWKSHGDSDIDENIGLKLIMSNVTDISYGYTVKMNNLIFTV